MNHEFNDFGMCVHCGQPQYNAALPCVRSKMTDETQKRLSEIEVDYKNLCTKELWDIIEELIFEIRRLQDEVKQARAKAFEVIKHLENQMDFANSVYGKEGDLCLFCHSETYDGLVGIVHYEGCPIRYARQKLIEAKERV